jgi:hypothetical protein
MNAVLKAYDDDASAVAPGVLTEMQATFVRALVRNGGNQTEAAREAGYGDPGARAWQLMRLPHILGAIRQETERTMACAGPKAVGWMVKALDDAKLPGAVRFQAAKWLAEASGHGLAAQRAALGLPAQDKPLSDMTLDELDAFISAGKQGIERLKQDRERTIEGTVVRDDARNVEGDTGAEP